MRMRESCQGHAAWASEEKDHETHVKRNYPKRRPWDCVRSSKGKGIYPEKIHHPGGFKVKRNPEEKKKKNE